MYSKEFFLTISLDSIESSTLIWDKINLKYIYRCKSYISNGFCKIMLNLNLVLDIVSEQWVIIYLNEIYCLLDIFFHPLSNQLFMSNVTHKMYISKYKSLVIYFYLKKIFVELDPPFLKNEFL